MSKLSFFKTDPIDELAWPDDAMEISLESSALEILTDFAFVKPLVIDASITVDEAVKLMQKAHVRLKIVLGDKGEFLGVVDLDDLNSDKIIQKVSKWQKREELLVTEFMRSKQGLLAFDFEALSEATIKEVVTALKQTGQQHCLVIDHQSHKIRGVVSASDIARKLHLPVNIAAQSTFLEIFNAVHDFIE